MAPRGPAALAKKGGALAYRRSASNSDPTAPAGEAAGEAGRGAGGGGGGSDAAFQRYTAPTPQPFHAPDGYVLVDQMWVYIGPGAPPSEDAVAAAVAAAAAAVAEPTPPLPSTAAASTSIAAPAAPLAPASSAAAAPAPPCAPLAPAPAPPPAPAFRGPHRTDAASAGLAPLVKPHLASLLLENRGENRSAWSLPPERASPPGEGGVWPSGAGAPAAAEERAPIAQQPWLPPLRIPEWGAAPGGGVSSSPRSGASTGRAAAAAGGAAGAPISSPRRIAHGGLAGFGSVGGVPAPLVWGPAGGGGSGGGGGGGGAAAARGEAPVAVGLRYCRNCAQPFYESTHEKEVGKVDPLSLEAATCSRDCYSTLRCTGMY